MKKFLSLVLALVMTMSLVTISAGAKDFTDDSKINYAEAVDVMSAIKVIDGYTDGSFNPQGGLTRGAAAKIICNMILGPTTAAALNADTAPFKDVAVDNTFAGYIAFCAKEGIINGYNDGTFRPTAPLTGYAFMKMLLGALGYDAQTEGYVGANWSINVAKRALNIGLDKGLVDEFVGAKALTREEACLYAFNTLTATMVEYDNSSSITVGDIVITTSSKAQEMEDITGRDYNGESSTDGDDTLQFCEKYFSKLTVKVDAKDAFGRPASTWKVSRDEVGTYADEATLVYTKAVKGKDIYKDLDLDDTVSFAKYVDSAESAGNVSVTSDGDAISGTAYGVVTEVFYDEDAGIARIIVVNPVISSVSLVGENDDDERIIKIDGMEFVTEEFEEDDDVIYTKADNKIQTVELVEKQSGTVTKKVGSDVLYIDGEKYTLSSSTGADNSSVAVKDDVDFYVDANGYIIKIDKSSETVTVDDLAYAEKIAEARGDYAVLRLANGSKKTVDLDKAYDLEHHLVSFKDSDDGVELTDRTTITNGAKDVDFTKGKPTVTVNSGNSVVTNSATVFLYKVTNGDDVSYKVYTGFKNAPSIDGTATVLAYCKDGDSSKAAVLVYIDLTKAALKDSDADLTFVAYDSGVESVDDGDTTVYYEYNAVVDGKITTLKVDADTAADIAAVDSAVVSFTALNKDTDGVVVKGTGTTIAGTGNKFTVGSSHKVAKVSNDVITLNGNVLAYTDDVQVFFVNSDAEIRAAEITDIRSDEGVKYDTVDYTKDSDGLVDLIIVVEK